MIDVLYFAWLRERIGAPKERIDTDAATVAALIEELKARLARQTAIAGNPLQGQLHNVAQRMLGKNVVSHQVFCHVTVLNCCQCNQSNRAFTLHRQLPENHGADRRSVRFCSQKRLIGGGRLREA